MMAQKFLCTGFLNKKYGLRRVVCDLVAFVVLFSIEQMRTFAPLCGNTGKFECGMFETRGVRKDGRGREFELSKLQEGA